MLIAFEFNYAADGPRIKIGFSTPAFRREWSHAHSRYSPRRRIKVSNFDSSIHRNIARVGEGGASEEVGRRQVSHCSASRALCRGETKVGKKFRRGCSFVLGTVKRAGWVGVLGARSGLLVNQRV